MNSKRIETQIKGIQDKSEKIKMEVSFRSSLQIMGVCLTLLADHPDSKLRTAGPSRSIRDQERSIRCWIQESTSHGHQHKAGLAAESTLRFRGTTGTTLNFDVASSVVDRGRWKTLWRRERP